MIKFFRTIREKLLTQGKTGTYLKYAMGEIVLVVIGILIALSINNWNQRNRLKNESDQVLKNLEQEVITSKVNLEKSIEFLQSRLDQRIQFLDKTVIDKSDSLKIKEIRGMAFFYLEPIKLPIIKNELGPNNKIIQSPELTKSMLELSEAIEYFNKGLEYIEKDVHDNILPYMVNEGIMMDLMVNVGMLKPQDYVSAEVYHSREFKNMIASSTLMTSALLEGALRLSDHHDQMLTVLAKER